jgi:hypothetical protein
VVVERRNGIWIRDARGFTKHTCPSLVSASVKENVSGTRRSHFFFQEPSKELLSFARIHPSVSMVMSQARPVREDQWKFED